MTICAKVNRFPTRPYEQREFAEMDVTEYERVKTGRYEKVLAEEVIEEIIAEDLAQLQKRIFEMSERYSPYPVIVTTPDNNEDPLVKHSFLTGREYRLNDRDAVVEIIMFRPKDPAAYQAKREREIQEWKAKHPPITEAQQAEFSRKAFASALEASLKGFRENYEQTLKDLGFASGEEMYAYMMGLQAKKNEFANEEQFNNFMRAEWDKRVEEARNRKKKAAASIQPAPPQPPSQVHRLPLVLNDEMIILCRVIGKNSVFVSMYEQYYIKWHHISDSVMAVRNVLDDEFTARFVYGNNPSLD